MDMLNFLLPKYLKVTKSLPYEYMYELLIE